MRVALIDGILEQHVVQSLAAGLQSRGHEVYTSGKFSHGFALVEQGSQISRFELEQRRLRDFAPDLVLLFRPQAFPTEFARELRKTGAKIVPWLSDGPVLFKTGYKRILEESDFILHCGHEEVLNFYESYPNCPLGVNFPFWAAKPSLRWEFESVTERGPVFYGNLHDSVRKRRVNFLRRIKPPVHVFGRIDPEDADAVSWRGYADNYQEACDLLARYPVGINFPQKFISYQGSQFDFPELSDLGEFQIPSRIVQYGAVGIPIISIAKADIASRGFAGQSVASGEEEFLDILNSLTADSLSVMSRSAKREFDSHFTPDRRVSFLEFLMAKDGWKTLDVHARTHLYRNFETVIFPKKREIRWPRLPRMKPRSRSVVLFGDGWADQQSELVSVRTALKQGSVSVRDWNPYRFKELLSEDPGGDFKALLRSHPKLARDLKVCSALIVVGNTYGFDHSMWSEINRQDVKVVVLADDAGWREPRRHRLAGKADWATSVRPDVAYNLSLLRPNLPSFAPLLPGPAQLIEGPRRSDTIGRVRVAPKGEEEINLLENPSYLDESTTVILGEEYQDYPIRLRSILKLCALKRVRLYVPRPLLPFVSRSAVTRVIAYGSEKELAVKLQDSEACSTGTNCSFAVQHNTSMYVSFKSASLEDLTWLARVLTPNQEGII